MLFDARGVHTFSEGKREERSGAEMCVPREPTRMRVRARVSVETIIIQAGIT